MLMLFLLLPLLAMRGTERGGGGVCGRGRRRGRDANRDVEEEAQRAYIRYAVEPRGVRDERKERELVAFFSFSLFVLVLLVAAFPCILHATRQRTFHRRRRRRHFHVSLVVTRRRRRHFHVSIVVSRRRRHGRRGRGRFFLVGEKLALRVAQRTAERGPRFV